MNHTNSTNGASLEDCFTNFFALADLCGIKWRRLTTPDNYLEKSDPIDDPVFTTYSKCLAAELLSVWRRVVSKSSESTIGSSAARNGTNPELAGTSSHLYNKELWLFWYGEEPDISKYISSDLIEVEQGSWENGFSYDCRTLLFKAYHNRIERCLMGRGFTRLGRWFVQPLEQTSSQEETFHSESLGGDSTNQLSFSFHFFVHGESTICLSVDVRVLPPVYKLALNHLVAAQASPCGIKVILAPYGMAGVITGQASKENDPAVQRLLIEWEKFYPLHDRSSRHLSPSATASAFHAECHEDTISKAPFNTIPSVIEVIVAGVKMKYPSSFVHLVPEKLNGLERSNHISQKTPNSLVNFLTPPSTPPELLFKDGHPHLRSGAPILSPRQPKIPSSSYCIRTNAFQEMNLAPTSLPPSEDLGDWTFCDPSGKSSCSCHRCKAKKAPDSSALSFNYKNTVAGSSVSSLGGSNKKQDKADRHGQRGFPSSVNPFHRRVAVIEQNDLPSSNIPNPSCNENESKENGSGSSQAVTNQPKTPTYPYKSPLGIGNLPSLTSNATTPGGTAIDSPHSVAPLTSIEGPSSSNAIDVSLSSISPIPSKEDNLSNCQFPGAHCFSSDLKPSPTMDSSLTNPNSVNRLTPGDAFINVIKNTVENNENQPPNGNRVLSGHSNTGPPKKSSQNGITGIKRPLLPVETIERDVSQPKKLLYDFSSTEHSLATLELPIPRNRRLIKGINSKIGPASSMNHLLGIDHLKLKDPYEFSDFDEENDGVKIDSMNEQNEQAKPLESDNSGLGYCLNVVDSSQGEINTEKDAKNPLLDVPESAPVASPKNPRAFTREEELKVSYGDLNNIFEPSSDEDNSNDFPAPGVPSNSNKAFNITSSNSEDPSKVNSRNNSTSILAELGRIFPTPPSMEHNATPSPCNTYTTQDMTLIDDVSGRDKPDTYPCSPLSLENVKDWSYVYKSPVQCKFISSSKYSPLPDIPSFPQAQLPLECIYKHKEPSNLNQVNRNQSKNPSLPPAQLNQVHKNLPLSSHSLPPHGSSPSIPYPSQLNKANRSAGYSQQYGNGLIANAVNSNVLQPGSMGHQLPQQHSNLTLSRLGSFSPSPQLNHGSVPINNNNNMRMMRPPVSIRNSFPNQLNSIGSQSSTNLFVNSQFPSPYVSNEKSVQSDSSCGSHFPQLVESGHQCPPNVYNSYSQVPAGAPPLSGHHQSQINNIPGLSSIAYEIHHQSPIITGRGSIAGSGSTVSSLPDVYCLLINLVLSDSMLNLFKDLNFESCTLCACNGNIKGSDVGIYLPDSLLPSGSDEPQYKCTCGFSAVSNRHRSYLAGLFYEDEIEITGIVYDPMENSGNKSFWKNQRNDGSDESSRCNTDSSSNSDQLDSGLIELLKTQCSTLMSSSLLLAKSLLFETTQLQDNCEIDIDSIPVLLNSVKVPSKRALFARPNALQRSDGCEVAYCAIIAAKQALTGAITRIQLQQMNTSERLIRKSSCLHGWAFENGSVPSNNQRAVHFLRNLTHLLQDSVRRKPQSSNLWEPTYTVSGPLTWRQFHRLAGRGTEDQCEPQPIPSLLVGHDSDWVALSPFALKFWEKLMLEPYSVTRDVSYVIVAPDDNYIMPHVKSFFKELSATYEMLRLGKHCPMLKAAVDGIFKVGKREVKDDPIDEWFNHIGDSDSASKLKLYAKVCRYNLAPHLKLQALDKTLFDSRVTRSESSIASFSSDKPPTPSSHSDFAINDSRHNEENSDVVSGPTTFPSSLIDPSEQEDDPNKQPVIVIYMVEPFTLANMNEDTYRLSCLGLLKSFLEMLNCIPEHLHSSINLQIVSLDAILGAGPDFYGSKRHDQMKSLALSVFNQCRKVLVHQSISKSLTGFGPAASLELFLKSKNPSLTTSRIYTPPFILAPLKDKQTELGEMFGDRREKSQILYCAYCITEDKKWLVVACSNDKGDLLESTLINIEIPKRTRRRKASVKKFGLRKIMDFIFSVMTEAVQPWRLVIGRLGRVGHGELREWFSLLSKKSLMKYSKKLRDECRQCSIMSPYDIPSILSACLVSLEADTALRVFPDHFAPDNNNSASSCHLSTPEEASCTHILVFPTSAASSTQGIISDPIGINEDELLQALGAEDGTGDLAVEGELDLFASWADSPPGSPNSPRNQGLIQSDSPLGRQSGFDLNMKNAVGLGNEYGDDAQNLLQQPLALGYYVSTAQTGPMPKWFWSSCPHHSELNPVFLKSALLIHTASVQQSNDDFNLNTRNCHPLDSNLTTDVLRFVLEGYNSLSWISIDPATHDRISCLPVHLQILMQLYYTVQALV